MAYGKGKKKKKANEDKVLSAIDKKVRTIINKTFRDLTNKKPLIDLRVDIV